MLISDIKKRIMKKPKNSFINKTENGNTYIDKQSNIKNNR